MGFCGLCYHANHSWIWYVATSLKTVTKNLKESLKNPKLKNFSKKNNILSLHIAQIKVIYMIDYRLFFDKSLA